MNRARFFGALGLALAATVGFYVISTAAPGSIGPGRYREGRGRIGRAAPSGAQCTPHINYALWSQQFDNGSWVPTGFGVAAPTVTANASTAPNGTLTADRVQIPITTGANQSILLQTQGHTGANISAGVWVKGNGQSSSVHLWIYANQVCVTCAYGDGVWSECELDNQNITTTGRMAIGWDPQGICGGGGAAAKDFFLWDAEFQDGTTLAPGAVATTSASASGC